MALTTKVTFTLDQRTVDCLRRTADRLGKPRSMVVREAVQEYSERTSKLSEVERRRLLRVFDDLVPRIPERDPRAVEREIEDVRRARRGPGRRTQPR